MEGLVTYIPEMIVDSVNSAHPHVATFDGPQTAAEIGCLGPRPTLALFLKLVRDPKNPRKSCVLFIYTRRLNHGQCRALFSFLPLYFTAVYSGTLWIKR